MPRGVTLPMVGNTTELVRHQPLSSSVGDYVKAIWEVAGLGAASTKDISVRLSVAPASVTRMLGRLREMGLAEYERYRGASLTQRGCAEALRLVRRHRLIETFLFEHLGYPWHGVHGEAEHLEHAISDELAERLAKLLGHPRHNPYGHPIPGPDGALVPEETVPLGEVAAGHRVRISKVSDEDASQLSYLGERGLVPGRLLSVKEVRALDDVITVEDEDGTSHALGDSLAGSIFVQSLSENSARRRF